MKLDNQWQCPLSIIDTKLNVLYAITEDHIFTEKFEIASDADSGQKDVIFKNVAGAVVADYIVLGRRGSETAEIAKVASISGQTITFTENLSFAHKEYDEATKILYNQRKFYRKDTGESSYTHLSGEGSPVDIDIDNPDGTYLEDSTGVATSIYKATYYNATTLSETLKADSDAQTAGDSGRYTSLYKIKREAGLKDNQFIEDDLIYNYRAEAESLVNGILAGVYSVPFTSNISKLITYITTLLGAGYLLSQEYGIENDVDISKTGQQKVNRAEKLLNSILKGDIALLDSTNTIISRTSDALPSYSNDHSDDKADKGEMFNLSKEQFRMTDPDEPLSS